MKLRPRRLASCGLFIALTLSIGTIFAAAQTGSTSDQTRNTTTQDSTSNTNPSRTTESHTKSGNRTVDKKTVEVIGPDGHYQPYSEVETESIQEGGGTTRTVTRTYNPGVDGGRQLSQVTEVETKDSGDGGSRSVQTTSNPDADGRLHVVGREITTKKKNGESENSQTTVYLPNVSGQLAPSMQVSVQQRKASDGTVDSTKTTSMPDANGGWQVYEVRNQKVQGTSEDRTTESITSQRDYLGNVSPVSQTVSKQTKAGGQETTTTDTSSVDVPGSTRDQALHPTKKSTTIRKMQPGRTNTDQQDQELGSATVGPGTSTETKGVVITGISGIQETNSTAVQYPEGHPDVVSVQTSNSDRGQSVQVEAQPSKEQ